MKHTMTWWWLRIGIVCGVLAAFASSTGIDFRDQPRASIQPMKPAFSIWAVIFPWLLASAAFATRTALPDDASLALVGSLALATAWALVVARQGSVRQFVPPLLLGLSAAVALVAVSQTTEDDPWLARFPLGLYAGWLSVATTLGLAIWRPGTFDKAFMLLVATLVVCGVSVWLRASTPPLAAVWASVLQVEATPWSMASALLGLATTVALELVLR